MISQCWMSKSCLCLAVLALQSVNANDCPTLCPLVWKPVCGSDNQTYENACRLQTGACQKGVNLSIKYEGQCIQQPDNDCEESSCTEEAKPACGSDGLTYQNECLMNLSACKKGKIVYKAYPGVCKTGKLLRQKRQNSGCYELCPLVYRPVCGSDSKTYGNACLLSSEACLTNTPIQLVHEGACTPVDFIDTSASVAEGEDPPCPDFCTFHYSPVCATNGQTYTNACHLYYEDCHLTSSGKLAIDYPGACIQIDNSAVVEEIEGQEDCPVHCGFQYEEVCGTNNVTYRNECQLKFESCQYPEDKIRIKHSGPCPNDDNTESVVAEEDEYECPVTCTFIYNPVCGSDGTTYTNRCELADANCDRADKIYVDYPGVCDKRCTDECPRDVVPICGSDGLTYRNECAFNTTACLNPNKNLKIVHRGRCARGRIFDCDGCNTNYKPVCASNNITFVNKCILHCNLGTEATYTEGDCSDEMCTDVSSETCSYDFEPLCGSDGTTYRNICAYRKAQCVIEDLAFVQEGICPICDTNCADFGNQPVCGNNGKTYYNDCERRKESCKAESMVVLQAYEGSCSCPKSCPNDFDPVCGSDGITYINDCHFKSETCREPKLIMIYKGTCSTEDCPDICETSFRPVCGSDQQTYSNECQLKSAACTQNRRITVVHEGACQCNTDCSNMETRSPVCGSNAVLYPSLCHLERSACINRIRITARDNLGACGRPAPIAQGN